MRGPLAALLVALALGFVSAAASAASLRRESSVPRCHASDLAVSLSPMGVGAGNIEVNVFLRNRSKRRCFLFGYVSFGLQDVRHRPQPSHERRGNTYFREDPGPHRVVLRPGGSAVTNLAWGDNPFPGEPLRGQCEPASAWVVVTPPGERTHLLAPLRTVVCGHGQLAATVLTSAAVGWRVGY